MASCFLKLNDNEKNIFNQQMLSFYGLMLFLKKEKYTFPLKKGPASW